MGHTESRTATPKKHQKSKRGRIPRGETAAGEQVVTFRLDDPTHAAIRALAIQEDRTMGYFFRLAIREFVERQANKEATP